MWTLANIAGDDNMLFRDKILSLDFLKLMVKQLCIGPKRTVYSRTAVWLISNILRGKPYPPFEKVFCTLVILAQMIHHPDESIQEYSLLSLSHLTESCEEVRLKAITNYGLVSKIVRFINHPNELVSNYAIRCAGNLSQGNPQMIKVCVKNLYNLAGSDRE
jgi:uncharacterized protein (UPF0248 family)